MAALQFVYKYQRGLMQPETADGAQCLFTGLLEWMV